MNVCPSQASMSGLVVQPALNVVPWETDGESVLREAMTNTQTTPHATTVVIPTGAPATNTVANHAERPEKFNGQNFKRWQHKMFFYLTTLGLARFLKETVPQSNLPCRRDTNQLAQKDTYMQPISAKLNMVEHAGSSSRSNSKGKGKDKKKNDKKGKGKSEYLAHKAGIVKQKFPGDCYNVPTSRDEINLVRKSRLYEVDRGGDLLASNSPRIVLNMGIRHEFTTPYSLSKTVLPEKSRTYERNDSSVKKRKRTPYELWMGRKHISILTECGGCLPRYDSSGTREVYLSHTSHRQGLARRRKEKHSQQDTTLSIMYKGIASHMNLHAILKLLRRESLEKLSNT
ncbi:hypothetical protein Tco_1505627 [Tanacetum coccineum]